MARSELSTQELKFVAAYTSPDPATKENATQSAIAAGYAHSGAAVQGYRLLKRAHVQQAIEKRHHKLSTALDISDRKILEELASVGYAAIPLDKLKGGDKIKALELLAKHKGLLQDGPTAPSITVQIGYLQGIERPNQPEPLTLTVSPLPNPEDAQIGVSTSTVAWQPHSTVAE